MEYHMPRGKRKWWRKIYLTLFRIWGTVQLSFWFSLLEPHNCLQTGNVSTNSSHSEVIVYHPSQEDYILHRKTRPYFWLQYKIYRNLEFLAPGDLNKGLTHVEFLNKLYFSCCGRSQKWSPCIQASFMDIIFQPLESICGIYFPCL